MRRRTLYACVTLFFLFTVATQPVNVFITEWSCETAPRFSSPGKLEVSTIHLAPDESFDRNASLHYFEFEPATKFRIYYGQNQLEEVEYTGTNQVWQPKGAPSSPDALGIVSLEYGTRMQAETADTVCGLDLLPVQSDEQTYTVKKYQDKDHDYDGLLDWQEARSGSDLNNASDITHVPLGYWSFNEGTWLSQAGAAPLIATGVTGAIGRKGHGITISSQAPAILLLPELESDARPTITLRQGSVRFWFRPDWTSGVTGGPQTQARLIEVGDETQGDWWALLLNETGTQIRFVTRFNGQTLEHLTANVNLSAGIWYQFTLVYGSVGAAIYVNTTSTSGSVGVPAFLPPDQRNQGFRIGSNSSGAQQAKGRFDELQTFNYPLTANQVELAYNTFNNPIAPNSSCALRPIAVHQSMIPSIQDSEFSIHTMGTAPGNYGWLAWNWKSRNANSLEASLRDSDSDTYENPLGNGDSAVSVGDYVYGTTGLKHGVIDALEALQESQTSLILPVWDETNGEQGAKLQYRVSGFVKVKLKDFDFRGQKSMLKFLYEEQTSCEQHVNEPPVIAFSEDAIRQYTAGALPVVIDPGFEVADSDSPDFNGGALTVSVAGNDITGDALGISAESDFTVDGANRIFHLTDEVGILTGGQQGAPLVVTFTHPASTVEVVRELASALTFSTTALAESSRTLSIVVNDGDGAPWAAGNSEPATRDFQLSENQPPQIGLGDPVRVIAGQPPVRFAPTATLTDAETGPDDKFKVTITVSMLQPFEEFDMPMIASGGQLTVLDGGMEWPRNGSLLWAGQPLGEFTAQNRSGPLVISLDGPRRAAEAVLQNLTFETAGATILHRQIQVIAREVTGNQDSLPAIKEILIGWPPVVAFSQEAIPEYMITESGRPEFIDVGFMVTDADSTDFYGGTLTISSLIFGDYDTLAVRSRNSIEVSGATILYSDTPIGTFSGGSGSPLTVTFNTSVTLAVVQEVARAIQFSTAEEGQRTLQVVATDGDGGISSPTTHDFTAVPGYVLVDAGPDQSITLPDTFSVQLSGTASKGFPPYEGVWSVVEGPGPRIEHAIPVTYYDDYDPITGLPYAIVHGLTAGAYYELVFGNSETELALNGTEELIWSGSGSTVSFVAQTDHLVLFGNNDGSPVTAQLYQRPTFPTISQEPPNSLNATVTFNANSVPGNYTLQLSVIDSEAIYGSDTLLVTVDVRSCVEAPAGLVAWWQGEDDAHDAFADNNGTLVGDATYAQGLVGRAFVFDGSLDGVRLSDATNLKLQDFSIECWIKRTSTTKVTGYANYDAVFLSFGQNGYGFGLSSDGKPLLTKIGVDSVTPNVFVSDTSFHHLAVTKTGSEVVFYVDGVAYPAPSYAGIFTFDTPAAIGARGDYHGNSFLGVIDELAVHNRVLSAEEVQSVYLAGTLGHCGLAPVFILHPLSQTVSIGNDAVLYCSASGTSPLTYQWYFGDDAIPGATASSLALANVQMAHAGSYHVTAINDSGSAVSSIAVLSVIEPVCADLPGLVSWWQGEDNGLDAASINPAVLNNVGFTPGKVGQAFSFTGSESFARVPANSSMNVGQGSGFTIEAWVNPANTSDSFLVSFGSVEDSWAWGALMQYGYSYASSGEILGLLYDDQWNEYTVVSSSVGLLQPGRFQHVAFTYDKSSGAAALYHNGTLVGTANFGTFTPQTQFDWFLGGDPFWGFHYTGALDEPSVYNKALSAEEIQQIYMAGSAGKCVIENQPPQVNAGLDQTIQFIGPKTSVRLSGVVSDDGLPLGTLNIGWSRSGGNGSGTVLYEDAEKAATTATFDAPGVYELTLEGDDGEFSRSDIVVITLEQGFTVNAGPDHVVELLTPATQKQVTLAGSVTPSSAILAWQVVGAPVGVDESAISFSVQNSPQPVVTFPEPGSYQLQLTATDAFRSATDFVEVRLVPNAPPKVNAGLDRCINFNAAGTVLNLSGAVMDDGFPSGRALDVQWTASGPGSITFDDDTLLTPEVTFSFKGVFTLTLTVTEKLQSASILTGSDTMTVIVSDEGTRVYTRNVDFSEGSLWNLNFDEVPDELRLNKNITPLPYIYVACSGRGTVARIDINTGQIVGEYATAPDDRRPVAWPSRLSVDSKGNVWVANSGRWLDPSDGLVKASITRIGVIVGGTRGRKEGSSFVPDPTGEYLAPPFKYNTCIDRDADGLIRTSKGGAGGADVRAWNNLGGVDNSGGVSTAEDEAIMNFVRVLPTASGQ